MSLKIKHHALRVCALVFFCIHSTVQVLKQANAPNKFDEKQYLHDGKSYNLPYEHTICLSSRWNWFQQSAQLPRKETGRTTGMVLLVH